MMENSIVFIIGLILNVLVLCYCCIKWKTIGNIKFLVATQAILSSLTISANPGLMAENIDWHPKGDFICYKLPSLVIHFLCVAILNLACLSCISYAQITDTWQVRRSSAILIFLAVVSVSTILSSPIFYSINKGWSILRYDGCISKISDAEVANKVHINVVRYAFWFLILQYIIPAFIIASRVVLILIHLWQEESKTDISPRPKNQVVIRFAVHAIFAILFLVVIVLFSIHLGGLESDKALAFLNVIFHKFVLFFVVVLCCPWYLIEMIRSQCENDESSCPVEYTKQENELNI
ncbi:uncharacterized protein LOC116289335 [Actinia tenebrosa]|uniref:Uncharacterized protein LOC116289335 n=1 Tax=Actinia tenebrosa TaxID=6105 RepID=A0A6P8HHP4_ACTTE|nr:uncharacterized protein LOC116289335 [Actinia tenebrosa]